ncbi:unnamed protein product [Parajaminaea phylloscopi]
MRQQTLDGTRPAEKAKHVQVPAKTDAATRQNPAFRDESCVGAGSSNEPIIVSDGPLETQDTVLTGEAARGADSAVHSTGLEQEQEQGGPAAVGTSGSQQQGQKFFSLFDPGRKDDRPPPDTSGRQERRRAAKDKKPCYTAPWLQDGADELEPPQSQAQAEGPKPARSSGKKKAAAATKTVAASESQPATPVPTPAPLPPLSLNVQGNKASEGPVHSFFAKRPKVAAPADPSPSSSSAPSAASSSAQLMSKPKKVALQLPAWPDADSLHAPLDPSFPNSWYEQQLRSNLPYAQIRVTRGKGKAVERRLPTDQLPNAGLASQVRSATGHWPAMGSSGARAGPSGSRLTEVSHARGIPESSPAAAAKRVDDLTLTWAERWRPRRADEVLGNTSGAVYLRDWLLQLQVSSRAAGSGDDKGDRRSGPRRKKRRIQTTVDKSVQKAASKKARNGNALGFGPGDDEDDNAFDFIIPDDEYFEDSADEEDTEGEKGELESIGPSQPGTSTPCGFPTMSSAKHLTNCIILYGPSGAGKTAAVYACAEELHYEVFELSPGTGKRGSKELNQAVGDLTRNHMVAGGGAGGGANRATAGTHRGQPDALSALLKPSPVTNGDHTTETAVPAVARQSLILLEEADLLYEEDRGFWTGVVDLIARSRRPVVLTCNDLSQVPLHTLPVQEVLRFDLIDRAVAMPYLEKVASASVGEALTGVVQEVLNTQRSCLQSGVDIRQALHQLQFSCALRDGPIDSAHASRSESPATPPPVSSKSHSMGLSIMRTLRRALEAKSFVDCHLTRPFVRQSAADAPPLLLDDDFLDANSEHRGPLGARGTAPHTKVTAAERAATMSTLLADEVSVLSGARTLWQQPAAQASPVALPDEGREADFAHAIEESLGHLQERDGQVVAALLDDPVGFKAEEQRQRRFLYETLATLHPLWSDLFDRCSTPVGVSARVGHLDLTLDGQAQRDVRIPQLLGGQILATEIVAAVRLMVRIDDFDEAAWHFEIEKRKAELRQAMEQSAADAPTGPDSLGPHDVTSSSSLSSKRNTRNSNRFSLLVDGASNNRSEVFDRQRPLGPGETGLAAARKSGAAFVSAWLRVPSFSEAPPQAVPPPAADQGQKEVEVQQQQQQQPRVD